MKAIPVVHYSNENFNHSVGVWETHFHDNEFQEDSFTWIHYTVLKFESVTKTHNEDGTDHSLSTAIK